MVIAKNIDRLLYIDSDTVVTGDIMPLFDMPMEGMPVGMSLDSLGVKHKALIGYVVRPSGVEEADVHGEDY